MNLRDPRWRVAPQGWSATKVNLSQKKSNSKTLDGPGQRFHCITEKELDSVVVAKLPVNTEYSSGLLKTSTIGSTRETPLTRPTRPPPRVYSRAARSTSCVIGCRFVVKTRNKQGQPYPPKTLYQLLTGLHRHALTINLTPPISWIRTTARFGNYTTISTRTSKH